MVTSLAAACLETLSFWYRHKTGCLLRRAAPLSTATVHTSPEFSSPGVSSQLLLTWEHLCSVYFSQQFQWLGSPGTHLWSTHTYISLLPRITEYSSPGSLISGGFIPTVLSM